MARKSFIQTIITPFLLLASFVVLMFFSFGVCLPRGCVFDNICADGSCLNEDINQHIEERAQFLSITLKNDSVFFLMGLVILFALNKYFSANNIQLYCCSLDSRPETSFPPNIFNFLILLFSGGLLNPKIY